jgi:hypothetical protein
MDEPATPVFAVHTSKLLKRTRKRIVKKRSGGSAIMNTLRSDGRRRALASRAGDREGEEQLEPSTVAEYGNDGRTHLTE